VLSIDVRRLVRIPICRSGPRALSGTGWPTVRKSMPFRLAAVSMELEPGERRRRR